MGNPNHIYLINQSPGALQGLSVNSNMATHAVALVQIIIIAETVETPTPSFPKISVKFEDEIINKKRTKWQLKNRSIVKNFN